MEVETRGLGKDMTGTTRGWTREDSGLGDSGQNSHDHDSLQVILKEI